MNRRHFLYTGSAVAASALVPRIQAEDYPAAPDDNTLLGNVIFSADQPGRYAKKAQGHLPRITITKTPQGQTVQVETNHEMNGYTHYIVKHQLFDQNFTLLAEHMFNPKTEPKPVSEFHLKNYSGTLFVTSMCNKHDVWLAQVDVKS